MPEWVDQMEAQISHTAEVYDTDKETIKRTLIKQWRKDLREKNKIENHSEVDIENLNIITRAFDK